MDDRSEKRLVDVEDHDVDVAHRPAHRGGPVSSALRAFLIACATARMLSAEALRQSLQKRDAWWSARW
jgi:hypothetical protein